VDPRWWRRIATVPGLPRAAWVLALSAACGLRSVGAQEARVTLSGVVTDAASAAPVVGALIMLPTVGRSLRTGADGTFAARELVAGPVRVRIAHGGYAPLDTLLSLGAGAPPVRLRLVSTPFELARVQVVARGDERRAAAVLPTTSLEGAALDRRMAGSVAAVIASLPGVTQRTNGPMAAQPVIRGLTGDRVAVLEDGLRTGDIATTAADHAVTIEPLTARRIDLVRGPAGLAFGSNTLGGVVNVVREDVPRERPDRLTVAMASQLESVNRGGTVSGTLAAPVGPFAVRADLNARTAGDSRTPRGPLPFTDLDGVEGGIGASLAGTRGFVGAAVRDYRTYYGVPSSFGGVSLPGSHAGGVYVDLRRTSARVEGEWRNAAGTSALRAAGNYVRFEQDEHERDGFIGTRFGQLAASGEVVARAERGRHAWATGVSGQWRDLRAEGSFTGTRPATVQGAALFAYDEVSLGKLRLTAGARYDRVAITPLDSTESRLLQGITRRDFAVATGSAGLVYEPRRGWAVGATAARAFRPPAIEELYSAGPHLASYAYEVGNPSLRAERGVGVDAFARHRGTRVELELTAFRSDVRDFVQYRPLLDSTSGLPLRDPRLRRYLVYRASQGDARLTGVEGTGQWRVTPHSIADVTLSYVRGSDAATGAPLPAMPPLRVRGGARHDRPRWFAGASAEWNARQGRLPPAPASATASCTLTATWGEATLLPAELCPTPSALLLGAQAGMRWFWGGSVHALTLAVDNALDAVWRDPLWRAKQVAPQPGRNVKLLYRVSR